MGLLDITELTHTYGDTVLFRDAEFFLNRGEHVGVVGQNGAGKSTLIRICTGQVVPDKGRVAWQPGVSIGYLDQYAELNGRVTAEEFLKAAFADLYALEQKMNGFYNRAAEGDLSALKPAAACQEELERRDFYRIDTMAEQVASGLGLLAVGLDRTVGQMSGGQRAKLILGKLLLEKPDVLLLDEPTNFLDKEHVAWLGEYLGELNKAFMVVSHDYDFLERISTRILDIDNCRLTKYYGSYSEFLKKKTFLREDYIRQFTAQQKEIQKTEEFIRRNIAGRKSRMAKGRQKQLDRMEKLEALDFKEIRPSFYFPPLPVSSTEYLSVRRLSVGYQYPVLSGLDFSLKGGQKVVLTGFNGIGKTTLLKTLTGRLRALEGSFTFAPQVKLNYFEQDLTWRDRTATPLRIICGASPELSEKEARRRLSRCGISSRHAMQEIGTLSGGEQAKVKLCLLTMQPCNFLVMDEPTNHLDIRAKEALKEALLEFPGTVLLVSHEEAFYRDWVQKVISAEKLAVRK